MNRKNIIKELNWIKKLFFCNTITRKEGMVTHYSDCEVYRPVSVYKYAPCTCGLNHRLRSLEGIAEKINPDYHFQIRKQEFGIEFVSPSQEEIKKNKKFLESSFGPLKEVTPEEQAVQNEEEWSVVAEVFGDDYTQYLKKNLNNKKCEECANEWNSNRYKKCPWCSDIGYFTKRD